MSEDLDYVVKLEKAIKEKYGSKAILNPRSLWDEKKEQKHKTAQEKFHQKRTRNSSFDEKEQLEGFLVSKKLINKESLTTCSTCGKYSFEKRDDFYFQKYDCCYQCFIQYVDGREERWFSGWRPKEE